MRSRTFLRRRFIVAMLLIVACSSSGDDNGGSGEASEDPCSLATPEMVAEAFGGTVADGEAGQARNCTFQVTSGSATHVDVFHYGAASGWDGMRSGFEENRGGTSDVPGVGDAAFHPNDAGPSELVVQAGGVIFSVSTGLFGGGGPQSEAALLDLASAIAAQLG